jgi:nucleotide-binding universal stress UspA family protein
LSVKLQGPVLVATALDAPGEEAIRQAADHARVSGVPLVVCHVMPEIYGIRPLFPHLREQDRPQAEAVRRAVMNAAEAQLRRALPEETPVRELRLEAGSPHAVVIEAADELDAGLVVVGAKSHEGGASLGGTAERIVRHARGPVLIARPVSGETVLAATDFSDPALPALEVARDEARRRRRRLAVLHAVDIKVMPMEFPESSQAVLVSRLIEQEKERATAALRELVDRYHPDIEPLVSVGPPAGAILEAAALLKAELIVVGTHGRSGLRHLTLGSVAETVVRRAPCSVLVVRLAG